MHHFEMYHSRTTFWEFIRLGYPNRALPALMWLPLRVGLIRWKPQTISFPDSIRDLAVDIDDLPEPARSHMIGALSALSEHGFVDPLIEHNTSTGVTGEKLTGACLRARHVTGQMILQTIFCFSETGISDGQEQLVTFLDEDNALATVNGRRTFNRIPSSSTTYHQNIDLNGLLVLHKEKLSKLKKAPVLIRSKGDMIRNVDAMMKRYFDHMLKRGVFVEVRSLG